MTESRARIVVLGYIVRGPIGGMTWHYLNYVVGLARLGHDVLFVEDSDDYESCYDPERHIVSSDPSYGLLYIQEIFDRVGLTDKWAYFDSHTSQWYGRTKSDIEAFRSSADILLNISGINPVRDWMSKIPVRVLIDTDPAFTQIKHLTDPVAHTRAAAHTHYYTFGENISATECTIPDDGFPWRPTRQPVALDLWDCKNIPSDDGRFTTVMQWDSYDTLEYDGRVFGMKSLSFKPYFKLPKDANARLELALGSPDAPRDDLRNGGWLITDPLSVSKTPWTYQTYIHDSMGEFAFAKQGYVETQSGWFSERSACYLASGRPVILQDTGFSRTLPVDAGLFAFTSRDEALSRIDACVHDISKQSKAAIDVAREYFDSSKVLTQLIE